MANRHFGRFTRCLISDLLFEIRILTRINRALAMRAEPVIFRILGAGYDR